MRLKPGASHCFFSTPELSNSTAQQLQVNIATLPAHTNSPLQRRVSLRSLAIAYWNTIYHHTDIAFCDYDSVSKATCLANGFCLRSLASHVSRFFISAITSD
jgi:hypothetical protein